MQGEALGWIDMRGLLAAQRETVRRGASHYVLNGIAYDNTTDTLLVTGKQWDHMYQIRIKPGSQEQQTPSFVEGNCHLGRGDGKRGFG